MDGRDLDRAITRVVDAGNCSGCGVCTQLDAGLTMALAGDGFLRPHRVARSQAAGGDAAEAVRLFRQSCPGVAVRAPHPPGIRRHPTMGPVVSAWQAWASDAELRHLGSSGGVLTALADWLVRTGQANQVIGARADVSAPRRTVSVSIQTRAEAIASAGSRYAPTANGAHPLAQDAQGGFIGKPCEVTAVRALGRARGADAAVPLLLSFFCAGTPSQTATDDLVQQLGVRAGTPLASLWYRGHGWPGSFTATTVDGTVVASSYDESWGVHLGPAVQWRCKICPDGVGEASDITAADFWRTDDQGYPEFAEGPGVSALLARTQRGHDVVLRAIDEGVIVASPIDVADLAHVQPLQRNRRETLLGRLVGAALGGRRAPRYRGFSLLSLARRRPRDAVRTARGTLARARAAQAQGRRR